MELYNSFYDSFMSAFPAPTRWLASLIIVVALSLTIYILFKIHWIFILLSPVLFVLLIPAAKDVLIGINNALSGILSSIGINILGSS